MEYRILGNTGLSVSVIALGCEGFVGKTEEQVHSEMDFAISKRNQLYRYVCLKP